LFSDRAAKSNAIDRLQCIHHALNCAESTSDI
jgi:hypothetical protein